MFFADKLEKVSLRYDREHEQRAIRRNGEERPPMTTPRHAVWVGTGGLLVRCAESWLARGHAVAGMVGPEETLRAWAAQRNLPWADRPDGLSIQQTVDVVFLVGWPEEQLSGVAWSPRLGLLAYQDSLLPAYAGWHATSWALLKGETRHGISWYVPAAGSPRVVQQAEFAIAPDDTAFTLNARCYDAALSGLAQLMTRLESGTLDEVPLGPQKASHYGPHQRPEAAGLLDFNQPAAALVRLGRALDFGGQPNPLAVPKIVAGETWAAVGKISRGNRPPDAAPGTILQAGPDRLVVAAAEDAVVLRDLSNLHGQPVEADRWMAAAGLCVGAVLPSWPAPARAALGAFHEDLAPFEEGWARRLAQRQPLVLPAAATVRAAPASQWEKYPLPSSAAPALARQVPEAWWAWWVVHAAFFLRVTESEGADVDWEVTAERPAGIPGGAVASDVVPYLIDPAYGETWDAFSARLYTAWQELRSQRTWMNDLLLRRPGLRAQAGGPADVRVVVGDPVAPPAAGPRLLVQVPADGSAPVWWYDASQWTADEVQAWAGLLIAYVRNAEHEPAQSWRTVPLMDPASGRAWLVAGQPAATPYPVAPDFGEQLTAVAKRLPDHPAVEYAGQAMSYREFDRRTNQLAQLLQAQGVGPDVRVGLCMERSPEAMVAVMGILKAGGCYVPLDPAYPRERLAFMMEKSGLALVLAQPGLRSVAAAAGATVIELDGSWSSLQGCPEHPAPSAAGPEHLCYVVYTSGSTGQPKGVAMTRRAMHNLVHWQNTVSTPAPGGRTFQYAALSFDVSVQEMLSTWMAGGTLVLVAESARRDPLQLLRLAESARVDRWFMPYAALQQVAAAAEAAARYPAGLRDVITAGEALRISPEIRRFFQALPSCRLHNQYGPSETHVVTAYVLEGKPDTWPDLPSIGGPIANLQAYVLDSQRQPVPDGLPGELYLGGDGLARGYLNQPELTAERFVDVAWPGQTVRVYRTGDLVRREPSGRLTVLGRRDEQVKIRGYRVELAEIEAALVRHPQVREAAVVAKERGGTRQLVAYVVPAGGEPAARDLRAFLAGLLPEYMVPAHVVFLDRMPLTPSGKIHRRSLPEPVITREDGGAGFQAPQGQLEETVSHIWRQVLGLDQVGRQDNFFDLGGDSLKLARVQAALRNALNREVPILDLFRFPTLSALSAHLADPSGQPSVSRRRAARGSGSDEPIAVVGLAGRFPGAAGVDEWWRNLCAGQESISTFTDEELPIPPPARSGDATLNFIKARGVLDRCEWFDAGFFGYAPREAELMDPQHRVFLECAWEALEHAGCDPARYRGAIGVFAAASLNTYLLYSVMARRAAAEEFLSAYQVGGYSTLMGNDKDYVATRVAYKLDLRGPGLTIQTACSSSLVALCEACQSLRAGDCDAALAGGVSITFPQKRGYLYVEGSIASSDGHCRPFDAQATGTVFGSGVGLVVLKRLSDAQADGDTIYAVIKGWALNNDGAQKAGYMAPSADGQAEAIRMAQERAGVSARTIGYVETHGTGTPLGDPIEIAGLTKAFRQDTADCGFCALGSVKANVGHLEAAAGVAGLMKAVLALHHRQVPPLLHFQQPNPLLDLPHTPFYGPRELTAWPDGPTPRRAAVSSFGVGGTNAHVILEEAPPPPSPSSSTGVQVLPLSARTASALKQVAANLAEWLEAEQPAGLRDVAYTLQTGRAELEQRGYVVARDFREAVAALRGPLASASPVRGGRPGVVFLFPGQGSQHTDMGRGLYESQPVFRAHMDACLRVLQPLLGFDLREVLYPAPERAAECQEKLTQTRLAQPALFAVEYALARWWMAQGVHPRAMIGHSAGEFVAACLAGVFSLEDALALLVERARLMQSMEPGQMLAVRVPEAEAVGFLGQDLDLAAGNAPALCVLSGPTEAITRLSRELEAKGVGARLLQTSHAFHSRMMEPALEPFRQAARRITYHVPALPFISTVTGGWITAEQATDPEHWVRQIRQPVRFSAAIQVALADAAAVFLEVGPGQALTTVTLQHESDQGPVRAIPAMRPIRDTVADEVCLFRAVGALWTAGQPVPWERLHGNPQPRRRALPTYPFERKRYWIEPPAAGQDGPPGASVVAEVEQVKPEPMAAPAAGPEQVLQEVVNILHDLSGVDREAIQANRPFLEMGFDSLFLTQVSLAFQRRFMVKLTLRQMLDDLSSPGAIAAYLVQQMPATPAAAPAAPATAPAPAPAVVQEASVNLAQPGPFGPEVAPEKPAEPGLVLTRHGPYAPINKSAGDALTPRQRQHLEALIARYTAKTKTSKAHTQAHRAHFSDPRAVAGFRVTWKEMTYPVVASRSAGSRIWDLDGNEFLDVTMGFGTNLFGHNPAFVRAALEQQLTKGLEIGPQSAVAGEVARQICALTGLERATFCNTGSEAVMGAVRAARTVTGRQRIVYFAGDYHGVNDEVLAKRQPFQGRNRTVPIAPGIPPDSVSQVTVLPYGEASSLATLRAEAGQLAAVLVEPVQSRRPELQPREFLAEVREITRQAGAALIFDEVITGFRIHPGGAQAWFGVRADLATYGKIIGGGMPIGVIAGTKPFMDAFDGGFWQYGDDSVPEAGVTFFAGTFVRHPLAMAAARAVVQHLQEAGPTLQEELNARTARFAERVNTFLDGEGVDLRINTFGSLWYFSHGPGFKFFSLLFHYLRDLGIHIWEGRPCFLSTAHSEADVDRLVDAFQQAIRAMQEGGFVVRPEALVPAQGPFPLTDAQQEIWLASRLDATAAAAFNESCALTFRGDLKREALETALQQLVQRHEALRTVVDASGERQTVQDEARAGLAMDDLAGMDGAERDRRYDALVQEEVGKPFDLAQAPLLRARLVRLARDHHVLLLTAHHIVCDGWSYDVMVRDFSALYSMATRGERDQRPRPTQFRDYARGRSAYRMEPRYDLDLGYWMKRLADPPPALPLPTDRVRPVLRTFAGAMEVAGMEEGLLASLKELGARKRCTLFSTLMALYAVLLHRLTGQRDLIIGIPAAGQQLMEESDLVGHCANLLPLRLTVDPGQPFAVLLAAAQQAMLEAYEHQGITFGTLLKSLQLPRDASRPPLIQVTFNVDPAMHGLDFAGLQTDIAINPRRAYQFDYSFNIVAYSDRLRMECNYNTDLLDRSTVQRWFGHYREIARAVAHQPDLPVDEIPLLTETERNTLLLEWNRTQAPYPAACVHELFEQEARAHPDRVALSLAGATLSYGELNDQANQLARHLRALGVGPDLAVGLCCERSLELVVGVLGILKAGGAYLPLDPNHPVERLKLQVTDARTQVAVGLMKHDALLAGLGVQRVLLDQPGADWRALEGTNLPAGGVHPSSLAYILYTSGSTGQPKGVPIEHRSVVRLVKGTTFMTWGPGDCMLQHSPLAFDASTLELWGPLLNGCRMAILPPGPFSLAALARAVQQEHVTALWLTGSVFHQVVDENPAALASVKQLLAGGEVLSGARIARLLKLRPDLKVTNGYGPTESTTFAATETFTAADVVEDPPPLGRPIANTQVYILDERLQVVPVGVAGEICIGGDGLARGYLNRPDLTEQAFVKNPLAGTPGDRLYRTGDRGRWRVDGRIEFLGRLDQQVKIRGFRIEPGEIESVLSTFPGLQSCAVVVRTDASGEKQLAAFVAMGPGQAAPPVDALRLHLRRTLPDFMLPAVFFILPVLPLSGSGKVDRRALQETAEGLAPAAADYVMPDSNVEATLAAIWTKVLGVPRVGRQDDFFALGGHSMAALKLINQLKDAGYDLALPDLFQHTNLRAMAGALTPRAGAAPVVMSGGEHVASLIKGQPGRPPLCLLPSDYGDLLIYANLVPLLGTEFPCIGLQCARLYERDAGLRSMPELAALFVKELRSLQPHGPYQLAGYCFGGHVALEMARLLRQAGEQVGFLMMIDARPYHPVVLERDYLRMAWLGATRASWTDWQRYLGAKWAMWREGALIDSMARRNPEKQDRRDLNRWILETQVLKGYHSQPYDGEILFVYPSESRYQLYEDPSCGWLHLAERVHLYRVSGSHVNMMKEPHVQHLADLLKRGLSRVSPQLSP